MGWLSVGKDATSAAQVCDTLSDLLEDLKRYGRPYVFCGEDGKWQVSVRVSVSPVGARFEVNSTFNHDTPVEAAQECHQRLLAAIASLGGK